MMQKQNQDHHKEEMQQMQKTDADLLVPVQDYDPKGGVIFEESLGKKALIGAIAGGIIVGFIFWMVASGVLPVTGLGQISAADYGAAAFLGFVTGSAIGGLAGGISVIIRMSGSGE